MFPPPYEVKDTEGEREGGRDMKERKREKVEGWKVVRNGSKRQYFSLSNELTLLFEKQVKQKVAIQGEIFRTIVSHRRTSLFVVVGVLRGIVMYMNSCISS